MENATFTCDNHNQEVSHDQFEYSDALPSEGADARGVGASRGRVAQTVAKWEAGESVPDLANGSALAEVLGVTLDTLANYKSTELGETPPPRSKRIFGSVRVGERGQMVIPKRAREVFGIEPGDELLLLGDEERGLALVKSSAFLASIELFKREMRAADFERGE